MKDERRPARNAAAATSIATKDGSNGSGHVATWLEVDLRLEVRERLVAVIDHLDAGDPEVARLNAQWLLDDLDAVRT